MSKLGLEDDADVSPEAPRSGLPVPEPPTLRGETEDKASQNGGSHIIRWGIVGFVLACGVLFWVGRRSDVSSEPRFSIHETAEHLANGIYRVTLDGRTADRWVPFDFGEGRVDERDPDVYVQRSVFRAPKGAIDLGRTALAEAELSPASEWQGDQTINGELQNPAIGHWYDYSYWTHLLKTKGHTYAVRRSGDSIAFFRIVSYYCLPESSGCMTLEYRLDHL